MKKTGRQGGAAGLYVLWLVIGLTFGGIGAVAYLRFVVLPGMEARLVTSATRPDNGRERMDSGEDRAGVTDDVMATRDNAIVRATRLVTPCVVGIVVTQLQVVQSPYYVDDFFNHFFAPEIVPRIRQVENMGSGFVVRPDGLILTNYHVVVGARQLFVNFADGRRMEGTLVGADPQTDIALISVRATDLPCVKMGDSDHLMIGEWAIAVGNPFLNFINDAHPTVTVGVVSALDRNFAPSEETYYQGMIQTDAAINPGNSGGPLVNAHGEVFAINTFIFTGSKENRGSIGIGFAIPINRVHRVTKELLAYGKRRQVWTGIAVQNITVPMARTLGLQKAEGVVIVDVIATAPGAKAGLRKGDVILRLGNRQIQSAADIEGFWLDYFVGDRIGITFKRQDSEKTAELILVQYPDTLRPDGQ